MSGQTLQGLIDELPEYTVYGRVGCARPHHRDCRPARSYGTGGLVSIETDRSDPVLCEVVGFDSGRAIAMPFANVEGLRRGCPAHVVSRRAAIRPDHSWRGRVMDAFGRPIDGKGPLRPARPYSFRNEPAPHTSASAWRAARSRRARALRLLTCCRGQRMGIFAGSGVGKSVLLSMLGGTPRQMSRWWGSWVNVAARCRNSCRMISARKASRVRWLSSPRRTSPHSCAGRRRIDNGHRRVLS